MPTIIDKQFDKGSMSAPAFLDLEFDDGTHTVLMGKTAKRINAEYEIGDEYDEAV